jgi:hypothetical protein
MGNTISEVKNVVQEVGGWITDLSVATNGNVPQDPLGQDEAVETIVRDFKFLRASALLDETATLTRHQDLWRRRPDAFFAGQPPALVLFVSHRWRSRTDPDPHGEDAQALRKFLGNVAAVAAAAALPPDARAALVPSLRQYDVFQAAHLLGNRRPFGARQVAAEQRLDWQTLGSSVLDHIGVWYDFACLPQCDALGRTQKDEGERQQLASALRRLHMLVAASTVLVLRKECDDYGERAWCVAELTIGQPMWRHIVLRTDRLGSRVSDVELVGDESVDSDSSFPRQRLLALDDDWRTKENGWNVVDELSTQVFFSFREREEGRKVPLFVTAPVPNFFPGHEALLGGMIGRLSRLSAMDHALDGGRLVDDAAELVSNALERARLQCTDPADRVFVGLLMLYARHVGAPEIAAFYGDCLRRLVDGRTMRLARYRERRSAITVRCWWVFADEPEDSARWKVPAWAQKRLAQQ